MRQNVTSPGASPDFRTSGTADDASIAADLELVAKKLADVSRKATRERDLEAAFVAATAEQERRAREAAEKTAAALDSVAEWVERTEGRLSDTVRLASDGQERTAGMLNDAIGLMTRRLDEIERQITETRTHSADAALTAVQRIEAQMAKLGQDEHGQANTAQIEAALRSVEERIAQVGERITQVAPRPRGKLDPRTGLSSAIEEIRSRQSELDDAAAYGSGRAGASRSQTELLRSLRDDFSRLAGQLDHGRPNIDALETSGLREEIESLRESVTGLATRQEISSLERAIHEIGKRIGEARGHSGDLTSIAQPLAAVQAEVRRLAETMAADVQGRAALDLDAISSKLDGIAERNVNPAVVERLSSEVGEVRGLLKDIADPQRVRNLAEQVAGLNHQITQVRRQFGNSDFAALTSAVDEIRTTVRSQSDGPQNETVARELGRLSDKIEGVLATNRSPIGIEILSERLDSLNENLGRARRENDLKPIEEMLRNVAQKLDEPGRAGVDLETIEKQFARLSERVERSGDPVVAALDRSMADMLAQIKNITSDTAEAADRAVRSALIHTLQSLPKSAGGPDLGALKHELADLKASQDETGKWTQDTLAAVHNTLDKVVSRLATLDHDFAAEPPQPKPVETSAPRESEAGAQESCAADAASADKRNESRAPDAAPTSKRVEESLKKLEAELLPHLNTNSLGAGDEILLEPGQGRPGSREALPTATGLNGAALDPNDIKASFIAAARRAAQAAASEAPGAKNNSTARRSTAARNGASGRNGGFATLTKKTFDERRRPILLSAAAIVLALGALQVSSNHFNQASKPTIIAAPRTEMKTAAVAPPVAQPREPVMAAQPPVELSEPRTTAAVPSASEATQNSGAPSQSLADIAAREREAALNDIKSAARLDAPKLPSKEESAIPPPQTLERIPNIASVATIPANTPPSLKQAVLAGDPVAVYELAARLTDGRGVARDLALAARLFEKAATHGLAPAQYRIGNAYEKGLGVARDLATAKTWYQRAADKGNARAMHNLAVLVAEGAGGKPDYATAIAWFRRAAQNGVRDSQFNLAVLLARGLGTAQDLAGSYTWFSIVAAQGDEDAARKRDEVAARLGPAELSAAKLAVERWRPDAPDKFANEVAPPAQGWSEAPLPPKRTASTGRI